MNKYTEMTKSKYNLSTLKVRAIEHMIDAIEISDSVNYSSVVSENYDLFKINSESQAMKLIRENIDEVFEALKCINHYGGLVDLLDSLFDKKLNITGLASEVFYTVANVLYTDLLFDYQNINDINIYNEVVEESELTNDLVEFLEAIVLTH